MDGRACEEEREQPPKPWLEPAFRHRLLRWIVRRVRDEATAEDLTQDVLLQIVAAEVRREFSDCRDVERFAQRLARNLVASEWRRAVRKSITSEGLGDGPAMETFDWAAVLREHLLALRPHIAPHLGPVQRRVLDGYLDDGSRSVAALSEKLRTHPSNVRRMLRSIARCVAAHT